jgi:hypothetical protein
LQNLGHSVASAVNKTMRPALRRFLALLFWFTTAVTGHAQIVFSFNYLDTTSGFNDATLGAERKAALQSAANTLASYFTGYPSRTVTITVNVSENNSGSSTLASAGSSFFVVNNSFQAGLVQQMIQTGNNNGQSSLGSMTWNFGRPWDYDDNVAGGTFDFKTVAIHELLHAVGFSSYISSTGAGGGNGSTYSKFDQFLTDASGNRLVDTGGNYVGGSILSNGTGSDVYFNGANAVAANGGQLVHIYSPATFLSGSSLSHLDTDFFTSAAYIMEHAVASGPATRTLSAIELGILTDLGYSVSAIPEPATYAALLGLLALGLALRRRA